MDVTGEQIIGADRDAVWAALNDPAVLMACIPGCESLDAVADNRFEANVLAKIGPVKARFSTAIELCDVRPPVSYTLVGEGKGGAAGFARGSASVELEEHAEGTLLRYTAAIQSGGKLAQVGARLLGGTVRKLSEQFFTRFAEHMHGGPANDA